MKLTKKIIGLLIALTLTMQVATPISYAQATLTEPEKACKGKAPDYTKLLESWKKIDSPDQNDYKAGFDEAQNTYHDYMGCLFNFAETTIMQSDGATDSGTMTANLGNLTSIPIAGGLIDWLSPDQACLTNDKLKEIISATEPTQMLKPILDAHAVYTKYLNTIGSDFEKNGNITDSKGSSLPQIQMLSAKSANLGTIKRQRKMEIDSSLMAIDLMFASLKELRLSFVMHVYFQCTIKFLGKYRRALEDLRNVVEPLPGQLEDASTT